jgi:hypothetical protein
VAEQTRPRKCLAEMRDRAVRMASSRLVVRCRQRAARVGCRPVVCDEAENGSPQSPRAEQAATHSQGFPDPFPTRRSPAAAESAPPVAALSGPEDRRSVAEPPGCESAFTQCLEMRSERGPRSADLRLSAVPILTCRNRVHGDPPIIEDLGSRCISFRSVTLPMNYGHGWGIHNIFVCERCVRTRVPVEHEAIAIDLFSPRSCYRIGDPAAMSHC